MAVELKRSLLQDECSGVADSGEIRSVLKELIDRMIPVHIVVERDPVLYEAHLAGTVSDLQQGLLGIVCRGWKRYPDAVTLGSSLTISFTQGNHDSYFDTTITDNREDPVRAALPRSLLYYPPRDFSRVQYPLPVPITVEFLNPESGKELLVRELEDVSYKGLSFRTSPEDSPPLPDMPIPKLELSSFEHHCYSASVGVRHIVPCCNLQGERYYRVGVVFDTEKGPIPQGTPLFKQGECEEMIKESEIERRLRDLQRYAIEIQIQDEDQRRPPVSACLEDSPAEGEPFLSLKIRQKGVSPSLFFVGERLRIAYTVYGTRYLFHASAHRILLDQIIIRRPARMIWMRRRRTVRCSVPEEKRVRFGFLHPFLSTRIVRNVLDLSAEGISISLDFKRILLLDGMRIEEAYLDFEGRKYPLHNVRIQSVKVSSSLRGRRHCRIGIFFGSLPERTREIIESILEEQTRPFLIRSSERMIPALWELFYKSGFIYPEKHASIQKNQEEIRRTWERLHSPETRFFRNLIFTRNHGALGTAAILQAFENSWILQHLTALKDPSLPISKEVNLGIAEALIMNKGVRYLKIYFRSENPWPNKNFRTFAEKHLPPHFYDLTLYRFYQKDSRALRVSPSLPGGIQVEEMRRGDEEIIRNYFVRAGKILCARSEALFGYNMDLPETSKLYRERGLRRRRKILVARQGSQIICFAVAEDASFGVNLSGLLNTFKIYQVCNGHEFLPHMLRLLINKVLDFYRSLGYERVTLMASDTDDNLLTRWGFTRRHDYYCLTMHRESLLYYLQYIREKYGKVEHRMLRRVK